MTRRLTTRNKLLIVLCALVVTGAVAAGPLWLLGPSGPNRWHGDQLFSILFCAVGHDIHGIGAGFIKSWGYCGPGSSRDGDVRRGSGDWPSYNKTLTSERYSQLARSIRGMPAS